MKIFFYLLPKPLKVIDNAIHLLKKDQAKYEDCIIFLSIYFSIKGREQRTQMK